MSRPENPEKQKPGKSPPEPTSGQGLRPGLERRLRAAKPEKSQPASKSVSLSDLIETAKNAKHQFTLAAIEIIEYAHIEKSKGKGEAIKLIQLIDKEMAAHLREADLLAPFDQGAFIIYLPDTQKAESKMILERLTRQICKLNQRRALAPQLSVCFKLVVLENIQSGKQTHFADLEKRRLADWLSRYCFTPCAEIGDGCQSMMAKDSWADSRQVLIKRFDFQNPCSQTKIESMREILSSIQATGLPLFPQLFDFHLGKDFVCLVIEPSSPFRQAQPDSLKSAHSLTIAVCDLFLQLHALSPPIIPPRLDEIEFRQGQINHGTLVNSLDQYLIDTLFKECGQTQLSKDSLAGFSRLMNRISEKFPADRCFSEAAQQLKNLTEKEIKSPIQKIRTLLKRHEEKLRREQLSSAEGDI